MLTEKHSFERVRISDEVLASLGACLYSLLKLDSANDEHDVAQVIAKCKREDLVIIFIRSPTSEGTYKKNIAFFNNHALPAVCAPGKMKESLYSQEDSLLRSFTDLYRVANVANRAF